jgi:4-amino-4-deoxy-L-arabinose transferase-like glycosyltransferase
MMDVSRAPRFTTLVASSIALAAFVAAYDTLDDFGLTIDEPINLGHGRNFAIAVFDETVDTESIARVWSRGSEHPPLTRFLIGVGQRLVVGSNRDGVSVRGGRTASAAAYAGIVFLVTRHAAQLAGLTAGLAAGVATMTLPRLFAHAHFASPEVISAFFLLWAWIAAGKALLVPKSSAFRSLASIIGAGLILGLALLTKLTAVLVPATVFVALLAVRGPRGVPSFALWSLVGVLVFLAGWPWMWPVDLPGYPAGFAGSVMRFRDYLETALKRADLYVWYFGRQYRGNEVPWHFAPFFFAVTTPIPLLVAGAVGLFVSLRSRRTAPRRWMIALAFVLSVAMFCLPIQRYDGERLFLFVFPPWGVLAGIGTASLIDRFVGARRRLATLAAVSLLAIPALEIGRLHPFSLSYYNWFVGGLKGAEAMGLEPTYWGDSLTPRLLERLASLAEPNDRAVLAPTLYAGHAAYQTSPGLAAKQVAVLPGDRVLPPGAVLPEGAEPGEEVRWGLLFHRAGYLIDDLPSKLLEQGRVVAEEAADGVWLARVVRLPPGWRTLRAAK